jgi:hypothetical protein
VHVSWWYRRNPISDIAPAARHDSRSVRSGAEASEVGPRRTIAFGLGKRENRTLGSRGRSLRLLCCVAVLATSDLASFVSLVLGSSELPCAYLILIILHIPSLWL